MREFVISTDSTASLPEDYLKENNIAIHPLHYYIDEEEFGKDIGKELTDKEFYQKIREGKMPTTSATNPEYIMKVMKEQLDAGFDILHESAAAIIMQQCVAENYRKSIRIVRLL